MKFSLSLLALSLSLVSAAPTIVKKDGTTGAVTQDPDVSRYVPAAAYANAAYCPMAVGNKVRDATITYIAGNGRDVQRTYVAYSPSDGIIVSVMGTNTSSISSIENDIKILRVDPDERLAFLGDGVSVNDGFQSAWVDSADDVLTAVMKLQSQHPNAKTLITGHSLGAAIALYHAAYITHQTNKAVVSTVFGLPRAGNDDWADAFDRTVSDHRRVTNAKDPVPHLPGESLLGYQHPSNEVWIQSSGANAAVDCAGQENSKCAYSISPSDYDTSDHDGPYFGQLMNSC